MDVTTLEPMAEELRQRFGLHDAVLVADRRIFSADNVVALAERGQRYRQQTEVSWPWTWLSWLACPGRGT